MSHERLNKPLAMGALLVVAMLLSAGKAYPHCDTMDGPVVKAAPGPDRKSTALAISSG